MHRNGLDSTKFIKRQDIYLILIFLVVGLITFLWIFIHRQNGDMVRITVDGVVQGTYSLEKDNEIAITGDGWTNNLVIKNGYADMTEADCPDKICVNHVKISQVGESIVCLPHKVVVEIVGEKQKDNQFDVIAN